MIKNYDGVFLNENHIGAVAVEFHETTMEEFYNIKFMVFNETFTGKTKFRTERECIKKIEELFNETNK